MSKRHANNRFLSVWEIFFFVAMVGIISALLFPKKEILSIILKRRIYVYPEFIKALIRVDPNEQLKMALIRNYIKSGQYVKAGTVLDGLRVSFKQLNYIDYAGLKYRLLKAEYYKAKNQKEKASVENKIQILLSTLPLISSSEFGKYLANGGRKRTAWILNAYRFESVMGNYRLALDLLQKYLYIHPECKEKYYKNITFLYIIAGKDRKAYLIVYNYMKTHKNYDKKASFFDAVAEKAIIVKNRRLTMFLLKIYKKDFPNDLRIERYMLTYALQSGDPYFARRIAIELSKIK